jgi:hypothetical protein
MARQYVEICMGWRMSTESDQYRAGFEAWALSQGLSIHRVQDQYEGYTFMHWRTWLASKREASTEPSAPQEFGEPIGKAHTCGFLGEYFGTCPQCVAAGTEPSAYALLRNGKVEGVERTIQCARMWVDATIMPLFMDVGALTDDAKDAALREALNTTLWLYRRLPVAYGKPPFVDAAIMAMAKHLNMDDVPIAIKERASLIWHTKAGSGKGEG